MPSTSKSTSTKQLGVDTAPAFAGSATAGPAALGSAAGSTAVPTADSAADSAAQPLSVDETKERLAGLESFIQAQMERTKVPGLAMAVVKDDEVIFSGGFGYRDALQRLPVTEDTLFMIASVTKSFTAMSMGLLVDEGKLDWDTPVRRYLPEFRLSDPFASERITPRDMGSHRSGLPRHDASWAGSTMTHQEMLERIAHLEPTYDFRTTWQYQNLMYATAGYMVGRIAGTTWEEFVQNRILTPLGMAHTNFDPQASKANPLFSKLYEKKDGEAAPLPFTDLNGPATGPAGVMISSVEELVQWVRLHLNKGKLNGETFVEEKTIAEMHKPHIVTNARVTKRIEIPMQAYGLGWFVETYRGHEIVHHGGNLPGFHSLITMMPEENLGIVMLTNLSGNFLPTVLSYHIFDLVLSLPLIDWTARFEADYAKFESGTKEHNEKLEAARKLGSTPSQPLEAFVGEYENPGYGSMAITLEEDALVFHYNMLSTRLKHYHYDQFTIQNDWFQRSIIGSFSTNHKGEIERFRAKLEATPTASEIEFVRKR